MRAGAALAAGVAVLVGASRARAQSPRARDRMATDERLLFGLVAATYGLRVGTAINLGAFERTPDDPHPETYWILPGALALALPVGALLLERRYPLRRGRGLAIGTGGVLGYLAALSVTALVKGEAFPTGRTLSGWPTFVGTTTGLALGALVGHLTDAPPADVLFVATGGVGGALLGGLACGAARCGAALGAWALAGELGMLTTSLLLRSRLRPTQPTMRLVGVGALGSAALLGGGVLLAHLARDGEVTAQAAQRASVFALGGLVVGAVTFFALGRAAEPSVTVVPTAQVDAHGMVVGVAVTQR